MPYYEADDVIGTLAKYGEQNKLVVRIASPDKDMAQLVNKNITIFDEQTEWDEIGVNEKFGIPPSLIIDYLTLIGDASDNVPGVEKIGPKNSGETAQEVWKSRKNTIRFSKYFRKNRKKISKKQILYKFIEKASNHNH